MLRLNNMLHIGILLSYFADFIPILYAEELWESSSELIRMEIYRFALWETLPTHLIEIIFDPLKFSYRYCTVDFTVLFSLYLYMSTLGSFFEPISMTTILISLDNGKRTYHVLLIALRKFSCKCDVHRIPLSKTNILNIIYTSVKHANYYMGMTLRDKHLANQSKLRDLEGCPNSHWKENNFSRVRFAIRRFTAR